ncbi:FAD/NAD(P)-binding protein [Rhizobium lemnae]|uniref:FAD/NAD(P)-binding protein n=1 Tax=Rhizobium lemnae TaxID=1214924 RepID=A0ABV8E7T3_9HYPH|nr:FAD/NAD(P)-binding protein [Rhizobium lemnae]MCJ8510454.1 FAD/NAD(P)-binding protein [Rhizobium lemnae]
MLRLRLPTQSRHASEGRRTAIVGGGFTGATLAMLLARRSSGQGGTITVFEPRSTLGTGLAYDTADPNARLNVAAHRIRAVPGNPGAFHAWLKSTGRLEADPQSSQGGMIYARRSDFGDFMQAQIQPELRAGRIAHVQKNVMSIGRDHGHWCISDSAGQSYEADAVVIATSNPPARLPLDRGSDLIRDNFDLSGVKPDDRIVIAGTGLTAMEMLETLHARGHRGSITMISRTGLLPRRQPDGDFTGYGDSFFRNCRTAASLLHAIRGAVDQVTRDGLPWQSVIEALRHQAPSLWQAMSVSERLRVKRHLLRWYEVHRHRMPPMTAEIVQSLQASGQLTILAAQIRDVKAQGGGVILQLSPRGASSPVSIKADHLLVAIGPDHAGILDYHRYLRTLYDAGFIKTDIYGFGIACDARSRAVARDGYPVNDLFIAGALARGTFVELAGVPELASQMERIARQILEPAIAPTRTLFIRSLPMLARGETIPT